MSYPDNWGVSESDGGAAFAPKGGVVQGADGQGALAYGLIVNVRAEQIDVSDSNALANATQRLIADLQKTNPNLKIVQHGVVGAAERAAGAFDVSEQRFAGRRAGDGLAHHRDAAEGVDVVFVRRAAGEIQRLRQDVQRDFGYGAVAEVARASKVSAFS